MLHDPDWHAILTNAQLCPFLLGSPDFQLTYDVVEASVHFHDLLDPFRSERPIHMAFL